MSHPIEQKTPRSQLHLRWATTALLWALSLLLGYFLLAGVWQTLYARIWLMQASVGCIYLLWVLWRGLDHNHRPGETQLLPVFGAGNVMTLLRGWLVAVLVGFLFLPWPEGWMAWVPAGLYTLASLADFLDGYLARLTNHATRLGEILDINIDGLGVLVASLLAIQYGQVPVWYLLVALARYLFLGGIWLRELLHKPVFELQPSVRRRAFAGVQMGFLFFILMPIFSPPSTHIAAALFALPFLVGFLVDWLAVSGVLKPPSVRQPAIAHLQSAYQSILLNWLPVALRLIAAILFAKQLAQFLRIYPDIVGIQTAAQILSSNGSLLTLVVAQGAVLLLLVIGAGGRAVPIAGLCLLGIQQMYASLNPLQIALAILLTAILYLGTGSLSLWKPEEHLIYHRAGEQSS
jgi:CDP-diacylglycerol--glycerol-3-phosphate 3-phosphatidyltransferase